MRIQLRRDIQQDWEADNPILLEGEIGIEVDTNKFKIGNGSRWDDIPYASVTPSSLSNTLDSYLLRSERGNPGGVASLDIYGKIPASELPTSLSFDTELASAISDHNSDTTLVHGISDTSALATKTYADNKTIDAVNTLLSAISAHELDTTSIHGIADTSLLATKTYAENAVSTHSSDTISVHGISDTSALATKTYADNAISTHNSDTTLVHGISDTSKLVTTDGGQSIGATLTVNNLEIGGSLTFSGTATEISQTDLTISDPLIYLADGNTANINDLGFVANYNDGTYKHTGLARDASSNKWKLFTGVTDEPTNTINFTQGSLDTLALGVLEANSATIGDVSNTELQYLNGVTSSIQNQLDDKLNSSTASSIYAPINSPAFTGTVSGITKSMVGLANVDNTSDANKPISSATQTALDAKVSSTVAASTYATINSPTFTGTVGGITKSMVGLGNVDNTSDIDKPLSTETKEYIDNIDYATSSSSTSYTISPANLYKLTEFTSNSSITITIPSDPTDSDFPIGSSMEIRQMGTGRITFSATSPATLVSTDSYTKTRTQYSSVVLEKRASNSWILTGDIDA